MYKEFVVDRKNVRNVFSLYYFKRYLWMFIISWLYLSAIILEIIYVAITQQFGGDVKFAAVG